nr:probable inactive shikimate kinase like 2, chloroplastic [Ipomoea batatas]
MTSSMATSSAAAALSFLVPYNPIKTCNVYSPKSFLAFSNPKFSTPITPTSFIIRRLASCNSRIPTRPLCSSLPTVFTNTTDYEFNDSGSSEVELRLDLGNEDISSKDISVDANESSLSIRMQQYGSLQTLMETSALYGKIKPTETIWYIDDDQLVINLKKQDPELKWPDIVESWESLTTGIKQLLKGTSIYLVGESTEINQTIARELAVGLGYTPLCTMELLETYVKESIDSWASREGSDNVAESESAIFESLSSHARAVIATLGEKHGAARRANKWRHLFSGFTVWLSQSEATDEDTAKEEARMQMQDDLRGYSNAEVVVKLAGWDPTYSKKVAQAALSALKQLILSDKNLTGKKSLYVRLGCRGDWPDIKPPGWDPSSPDVSSAL